MGIWFLVHPLAGFYKLALEIGRILADAKSQVPGEVAHSHLKHSESLQSCKTPVANGPSREQGQGPSQQRNNDPRALPKRLEISLRLQNLTGRRSRGGTDPACRDGHMIYRAELQQDDATIFRT